MQAMAFYSIAVVNHAVFFTEIIDTETNEPYVLHLLEMKRSGYSEKVYKAYSEVLEKIKKECFEDKIFKANYTKEIITYG